MHISKSSHGVRDPTAQLCPEIFASLAFISLFYPSGSQRGRPNLLILREYPKLSSCVHSNMFLVTQSRLSDMRTL